MEGGQRVNIWKTAEVTLSGLYQQHKTVTYFFKQLLFFPMSNCLFLRKNPTILRKGSLLFTERSLPFLYQIRVERIHLSGSPQNNYLLPSVILQMDAHHLPRRGKATSVPSSVRSEKDK